MPYRNFGFDVLWLNKTIPRSPPGDAARALAIISAFSEMRRLFVFARSLSIPKKRKANALRAAKSRTS